MEVQKYTSVDADHFQFSSDLSNVIADAQHHASLAVQLLTADNKALSGFNIQLIADHPQCFFYPINNDLSVLSAQTINLISDINGYASVQLSCLISGSHQITAQVVVDHYHIAIPQQVLINFIEENQKINPNDLGVNFIQAGQLLSFYNWCDSNDLSLMFVSSDQNALLPLGSLSHKGLNGWYGKIALQTVGQQNIILQDNLGHVLREESYTVLPAQASQLIFDDISSVAYLGQNITLSFHLEDPYGNIVYDYNGMVNIYTDDPLAWGFGSKDLNLHHQKKTSVEVQFQTPGRHQIGLQANGLNTALHLIDIESTTVSHLNLTALTEISAGTTLQIDVVPMDAYGFALGSYDANIQVKARQLDNNLLLLTPKMTYHYDPNGALVIRSLTLTQTGTYEVTVMDIDHQLQQVLSSYIHVRPALVTSFSLGLPQTVVAGDTFDVNVYGYDYYSNLSSSYSGVLQFSVEGLNPLEKEPAPFSWLRSSNGTLLLSQSLQLIRVGSRKISLLTDLGGILTTQNVNIVASEVTSFSIYSPQEVIANAMQNVTIYPKDIYGNINFGYNKQISLSNSSPTGSSPNALMFMANNNDGSMTLYGAVSYGVGANFLLSVHSVLVPSVFGELSNILVHDIEQVYTGSDFSCARLDQNQFKCWGSNASGQLGLGDTVNRGFVISQMGSILPKSNIGNLSTIGMSLGQSHACAILESNQIKCWGDNTYGQLGYQDTVNRGVTAQQMGDAALPAVNLGLINRISFPVRRIFSGDNHNCAVNSNGYVRCWGSNAFGQLFYGDRLSRGATSATMGTRLYNLPAVSTNYNALTASSSAIVLTMALGSLHTCYLAANSNFVFCAGDNSSSQLGQGLNGVSSYLVELGSILQQDTVVEVAAGSFHNCVLFASGKVKCWGNNSYGQLGYGDTSNRGSAFTMGDSLPLVDLGSNAVAKHLVLGGYNSCAVLMNNSIKCWGYNGYGQLGLGDVADRGNVSGQMGDLLPAINLGSLFLPVQLSIMSGGSMCAMSAYNQIKCWGNNIIGQLGLGDISSRGGNAQTIGNQLSPVVLW